MEPEETQPLKLALVTSQMICTSLLGDLLEAEDGEFKSYQATFIAHCKEEDAIIL